MTTGAGLHLEIVPATLEALECVACKTPGLRARSKVQLRAVQLQPRELLGGARDPVEEPKNRDRLEGCRIPGEQVAARDNGHDTRAVTASIGVVDANLDGDL